MELFNFFDNHLLTFVTFIPFLGMLVVLLIPSKFPNLIKWASLVFTSIPLVFAIRLFLLFDRTVSGLTINTGFQFVEKVNWIKSFNIEYFMAVDGLSLPMVLLTALLCPICIIASWNINKAPKGYFSLFLLLNAGMQGVFCALDFFLFYIFWEVMLLPMYFLIGIWGGPRREYAAIKFFLYTLFGSVLMLLCILYFYFTTDPHTFDMTRLFVENKIFGYRHLLWILLYICFAIKVPVFPFHTWLPDAHVEAPTAISVILAGILLKMGTYGILRINYPMLPDATIYFAPFLAFIGMINIVYGALCAMAQKDLKKLVAYSSISHMGYCLLGMASFTDEGINGAVFQMFNHGTITAMLFLLVGVIYDRAHHREIEGFGGLANRMPVYTGVTALAYFAALGLPGLSAFISEILVFLGAFQKYRLLTIISASGIILSAGYLLWTIQRIFLGKLNEKYAHLPDINLRELVSLAPLALIVIVLGVYPHPILDLMKSTLTYLNQFVTR
jgi:NADH-quinone oxidoreductase subunit M